jgi:hypothetical protein
MNDVRRFGIADGLIVIAGVAAGLGLVRSINPNVTANSLWSVIFEPRGGWTPWYALQVVSEFCVVFFTPFVGVWTLACLLVQLRKPRPRRLRRSPGFVACLLPTLGAALTISITWICLGTTAWTPTHRNQGDYETAQVVGGLFAGSSVVWAWTAMKLCGIFHPRPTWTDRLGRLTGLAWIVVATLSGAYLLLLI